MTILDDLKKVSLLISLAMLITLTSCMNNGFENVIQEDEETDSSVIDSSYDLLDEDLEEALDDNDGVHEEEGDAEWNLLDEILITLTGSSAIASSENVSIEDGLITITGSGTYRITGKLYDGSILVDTEDEELVRLVLDGVSVSSSTTAPMNILGAEKAVIIVLEGTENTFTDGSNYVYEGDEDEPNAAFFSKDDLSIYGSGKLIVTGNYNDALASKDGLIIDGPEILITAQDDGIRGKDYLILRNSTINIVSDGDAFKSDEDEDSERGYIFVESGEYTVVCDGDGFAAETDLLIVNGTFHITAGGGSNSLVGDNSTKGMKAGQKLLITDGLFMINSADDAVHSNGHILIEAGTYDIASGDDGMHADSSLYVKGGNITISDSY